MPSGPGENLLKRRIGFRGLLAMSVGLNIDGALLAGGTSRTLREIVARPHFPTPPATRGNGGKERGTQ